MYNKIYDLDYLCISKHYHICKNLLKIIKIMYRDI